jgi:hypothetical protein
MKGYYCNTCKKNHKVGHVCDVPKTSWKELEDRVKELEDVIRKYVNGPKFKIL